MKIQAVIFDLDGVLVHGEPVHMRAWQKTLAALGLELSKKDFDQKYIGLGDRDFLPIFLKDCNTKLGHKEQTRLIQKKQELLLKEYQKKIPVFPGVQKLLEMAFQKFPLALVTGSQSKEVDLILDKQQWRSLFTRIVTHNDVKKGKPDPEGFLKAFPKIPSQKILVIEDSPRGIEAANRAGMTCIAIATSYAADQLKKAKWIVQNHQELTAFIESL